jgi:hypothetical protein
MGASLALDRNYDVIGVGRRHLQQISSATITAPHAFSLSYRCHSAHKVFQTAAQAKL